MIRRILALGLALLALVAACGDDDSTATTTTTVVGAGDPEGVTFAVDDTDDGARLRIRVGDDIRARLGVDLSDDPPWRVSISNPGAVTTGDRIRFLPSETGEASPYDEFLFRAVRIGEADVTFDQQRGPKTFTITVIVYAD